MADTSAARASLPGIEVITLSSDEDVEQKEEPVSEYQSKAAVNTLHGKKATGLKRPNCKTGRKPTKRKKLDLTLDSRMLPEPPFPAGKVSPF